jgi:hypothetical protein
MTYIPEHDAAGGIIGPREKCTITGWHFQLHSVDFTTSTIDGFFNKSINPVTLALANLGYVTWKLYKLDGTLITDQPTADAECRFTVFDWCADHEMEIRGAAYRHQTAPNSDVYFWCSAAPGIANLPFAQGGINLRHLGSGSGVDSDGKAAKYLHPSNPMVGINKFRMMLHHDAGVKHKAMILFQLYKP